MKKITIIACALALLGLGQSCRAQDAMRHPAQITFRVVTDDGKPVPNIDVTASTFLRWEPGEGFGRDIYEDTKSRTNSDGLAVARFTSARPDCNYGIYDVPGYYATRNLQYRFKEVKGGRWEPWNPVVDVVLKPVLNPIAMYARRVGDPIALLELPEKNRPCGFDLIIGDWVTPHGKGKHADLVFTLRGIKPIIDPAKPFEYELTLSFSNEGDGLQSVLAPPHKGSDLRLPRIAPEQGYEPKLIKHIGRPEEGKPMYPSNREDQNYFVRVRTVFDEHGNIKSAFYSKISGDISCDVINSPKGYLQFAYCINPTPLDRNLEFDPKKNLFGELPFSQRVNEP